MRRAAPPEKGLLESITIRGFRSIKSIEKLELRRINVLVGANGSGKSNFLGAFDFFAPETGRAGRVYRYGRRGREDSSLRVKANTVD